MSATTAWRGALSVLGGFPVNVRFYNRVKSRSGESFRQLDPEYLEPVSSVLQDKDGKVVARDKVLKGVEHGKGNWVALSDEQVELIKQGERSEMIEPEAFVGLDSVDLSLALSTYVVTPDPDTPGSERACNIVWNGLLANEIAYVSRLTMRAGSRDAIVLIYANEDGLFAATMPFQQELHDMPSQKWERDAKQAKMFMAAVENIEPFELGEYASEYAARRAQAVEAALHGKPLPVNKPQVDLSTDEPDLMAALEAATAAKGQSKAPKPKPVKKPARRAPKAKAK